ncbi:prolyl aminopeptidase [Actinophytocola sediminis]
MRLLYPPIEPHEQGMLDVGDGHRIYWEVSGNPDGRPVVFLHGGPGSSTTPLHRRMFDPAAYRIVLTDQRGCGRSTPSVVTTRAGLVANTTWHLVSDLEQLRAQLRIDRWQVFGGSWGATLAMAYAQTHPDRVLEIILRGVFLLRRAELDWMYRGGAGHLFPEAWADFTALVPAGEDPLAAYHQLVNHEDEAIATEAAAAWSNWEGAAVSLVPNPSMIASYAEPRFAVAFARVALHYFTRNGWLVENQLVRDAGKLGDIPGRIVQGRYDVVCPPTTAWQLHQAWPGSTLKLLPEAGHSVADRGVLDALLTATDEFRP